MQTGINVYCCPGTRNHFKNTSSPTHPQLFYGWVLALASSIAILLVRAPDGKEMEPIRTGSAETSRLLVGEDTRPGRKA